MYPHVLTHQASQSVDPFTSILGLCISRTISDVSDILLVELECTQCHVQLEQCQCFQ
jgi:hypothetical protein